MSVGDVLKEIRETNGYQLQEVSDKTTINYTLLSRIETGKRLPTKSQVQKLAQFYNYNESELIKQLISDKTIYEVQREELGLDGFHLAEQKLKYGLTLFNDYRHQEKFQLQSRRYIGNKAKLTDWIMDIIESETDSKGTFIDVFSGTSIVAKSAMKKYSLLRLVIVHRLGEVPVSEASVVIGCSSQHRPETFSALEWIMNKLKKDVPIWKREVYCDGKEEWVHPGVDGDDGEALP